MENVARVNEDLKIVIDQIIITTTIIIIIIIISFLNQ